MYFRNILCSDFKSLINLMLKHTGFASEGSSYEVHASSEKSSATLCKGALQRQETFHYQPDRMKGQNNKSGRHWIHRCQLPVIYHSSRIVWTHSNLCEVHDNCISTACTLLIKGDGRCFLVLMSAIIHLVRSILVLSI